MAEVELKAGAKLDMLNRREMKELLDTVTRGWFNEVSRGDRYRRFSAGADVASTAVSIGGPDARDSVLGPAEGFVWAVKRLTVGGLATNDAVSLFVNDSGPASLVREAIGPGTYCGFSTDELVLYPGDVLLVEGTSLAATGRITVSGQARELPMPLAWRLAG